MEKGNKDILIDVLDHIAFIEEELQGMAFEDYRTDRKKKILIVNSFTCILENINDLPDDFKKLSDPVPWNEVIELVLKFNNMDFGIDDTLVWHAAKIELKHLRRLLDDVFFQREKSHIT
jgi:uncharacterized protein with HEPN domain